MKVKIIERGFEAYTGQMGMELFKDGVSVNDVPERRALRFAALFSCVWEDGSLIKFTAPEEEPTAPVGRESYRVEASSPKEAVAGHDGDEAFYPCVEDGMSVPPKVEKLYTIGELEHIASKQGINGLREIAKPLGIRGTSINGLIESILEVAGKKVELPDGTEVV